MFLLPKFARLCCGFLMTACASAALAADVPDLIGHHGRWLTAADGRVRVLHGVNVSNKKAPYEVSAMGFDSDDADVLAAEGFNTVRLGIFWKAVEPQPGVYDDRYLDKVQHTIEMLASRGIHTLVDLHQDMMNEKFKGAGFPDWAILDDGLPAGLDVGFPGNYFTSPGMMRAWDNFLGNKAGPGGVGLQDRYAAAWSHVASRMKDVPGVLGYDLMNEPSQGEAVARCFSLNFLTGCPLKDMQLASMYERVQKAIREVDVAHMVFWEPYFNFDNGARTWLHPRGDDHVGLSFHPYCLTQAVGGSLNLGGLLNWGVQAFCSVEEQLVMSQAEAAARPGHAALLVSEFGATEDLRDLAEMVRLLDKNMLSWQYWAWYNLDFATERKQDRLIFDISKPPTPDNLVQPKLNILVRPYPRLVAGTPVSWSFDAGSKQFKLEYLSKGVAGQSMSHLETEVFIPRRQYPSGYKVSVTGGVVTSAPGAERLTVRGRAGATRVRVSVSP